MKFKIDLRILLSIPFIILFTLLINTGFASVTYDINATDTDFWTRFTFISPANNSLYYNKSTDYSDFINMSTNNSFVECKFMWDMNGTYYNLKNATTANISWTNASSYTFFDNQPNTWHNFTFYCHNASAANATFTNSSLFRYRMYDSTSYTILDETVFVNNSVYATHPVINITVSHSVKACYLLHNDTTTEEMTNTTPRNTTLGHTNVQWFTNSSTTLGSLADTAFGVYHNITFYCEDAYGNKTWYNSTLGPIIRYGIDTTTPKVNQAPTFTLGNYSTEGNYLAIEWNISDNNPGACWVQLYFEDGTTLNTTGTSVYNTSVQNQNCSVNVTPTDISKDGYAVVVPSMLDSVGNYNNTTIVSGGSQNYIFYRLKTGWNLVSAGYENHTLSQIGGEFTNVTYVSIWDILNKSFSTWTAGSATNANIEANYSAVYGAGSSYIYVAQDIITMRRHYALPAAWPNATLYHNTTAARTSWNIVGVHKQITDLNASIMADACTNTTGQIASPIGANCANITWVAWWDTQNGEFCAFVRNRLATGCNYKSSAINLTRGDAIWIAVQDGANMTLMRDSW